MPEPRVEVHLTDEGAVSLTANHELSARHKLYLRSVLGGEPQGSDQLWTVPLRLLTSGELIGRLSEQFERDGVAVILVGEAERAAQQELERRRSFQRTMEAGAAFRSEGTQISEAQINERLELVGWDFQRRSLRPHQLGAVAHALTVLHAANFSVPGAGKTATTLAIIAAHLASETIDTVVVVGPLASFRPWESEAATALPGVLHTQRVRGNNSQARAVFYRSAEPRDLLLLTYPTVVADLNELERLGERRRLLLVVDESHRIKRFRGGQWSEAMVRLASSARVRIILSGTPMPQGAVDLWSQLNVLWPKQELTGSRETFKARADSDFQSLISGIQPVFTRTSKSALGIPDYRVINHEIDAGPLQAEIIDLIAQRFLRQLEDAESWRDKLATLRRARPLRLLQAASNPDLLNLSDGFFSIPPLGDAGGTLMQRLADYRQREIPAKFDAALDILRDQVARGERTVVWTSFVKNIDQFADLVRRQLGVGAFVVDGRVPVAVDDVSAVPASDPDGDVDVTREERIEQFLSSPEPSVLIANPAACGESVSLHSACTTAIYLDRTYDCARYLQSVDRIHRLGLAPDADVRIHILQTTVGGATSVDQLVDASLAGKRTRMEQLLEGSELVNEQIPSDAVAAGGDDQDLEELLRYLLGQ